MEFACGSDPTRPGAAMMSGLRTAAGIEFTYTRNKAALTEVQFAVEWSDSLAADGWNSAGVTDVMLSDDGMLLQVKATVPLGEGSRRFVRLRVLPGP
jgi:hypothetical protein